ncbi:hypothetical protein [Ralstonia pseudosolanacearum]|uniref:hypothetical protein n=1 Tax=Ralstonia pseudosolanacearum TaxID=1310165 RepID=UPI00339661A5
MAFYFVGCKGLKKQDDAGECVFPLPGAGLRDGGSILVDFVNPDCPQNAAGLEIGVAYEFEQENGFSVCNNLHEYSAWLEELDDLVGSHEDTLDADEPGPFRELILYGGLGEIIGPVASAKLVADFIEWDERARSLADDAFYEWYARMRKVFEYAGEAGAVWSDGETYR